MTMLEESKTIINSLATNNGDAAHLAKMVSDGWEYNTKACDKTYRQGEYLNFKARGLVPGSTYFVGVDPRYNVGMVEYVG